MHKPQEHLVKSFTLAAKTLAETDILYTLFTDTLGKIKATAAAGRRQGSRLSFALHPPLLSTVRIYQGRGIAKIIGAKDQESFGNILNLSSGPVYILAAQELLQRSLADEDPHPELFLALQGFLRFLNSSSEEFFLLAYTKFQIKVLQVLGFEIQIEEDANSFDLVTCSFIKSERGMLGGNAISSVSELCRKISTQPVKNFTQTPNGLSELHTLVAKSLEYHLERKLESENLLKQFYT